MDDPNLRRPTYGYIDYEDMATSAREHNYHVSIAMVPLDGRFMSASTVRLFKREQRYSRSASTGTITSPTSFSVRNRLGRALSRLRRPFVVR